MELDEAFSYLDSTYFGPKAYENDEIEKLPSLIGDCKLFIDVGASLGQYTYHANTILEHSTIIAIEPDPDRYRVLSERCAKWETESSNEIRTFNAAVGDSHDPVTFYVTRSQISGGLFPVPERSDDYQPITIQQVTLDDLHQPGISTFVKIDVEGAELRVLRGAEAHMREGLTKFLTEITWWGDRERSETAIHFMRFAKSHGLEIHKLAKRHTSDYLLTPHTKEGKAGFGYLRLVPLLVAKAVYGRYVPRRIRVFRERRLNARRLNRMSQ